MNVVSILFERKSMTLKRENSQEIFEEILSVALFSPAWSLFSFSPFSLCLFPGFPFLLSPLLPLFCFPPFPLFLFSSSISLFLLSFFSYFLFPFSPLPFCPLSLSCPLFPLHASIDDVIIGCRNNEVEIRSIPT